MRKLTHGSLFSGVGGFDIGAEKAGLKTLWQCEIDNLARSVLERHWPDTIKYIDIKDMNGAEIEPVDIISFGSPCQDLSIAGKQAGLAGDRSGLYFQAIRIIKEMRDATQGKYPRYAIWENVRGALQSNKGEDFREALQGLADIGALEIGYRLVNAEATGIPQRRERIFVIADFTGHNAGEILAEPDRLLWHPKKSRKLQQTNTAKSSKSLKEKSKTKNKKTSVRYNNELELEEYILKQHRKPEVLRYYNNSARTLTTSMETFVIQKKTKKNKQNIIEMT